MLYWIYEIPALSIVGLFAALFVSVCWLGIVLQRLRQAGLLRGQRVVIRHAEVLSTNAFILSIFG